MYRRFGKVRASSAVFLKFRKIGRSIVVRRFADRKTRTRAFRSVDKEVCEGRTESTTVKIESVGGDAHSKA